MRLSSILVLLSLAGLLQAEDRAYLPKVSPNETPVLGDGETVVVVQPDGDPIGVRVGDGTATGGRWLYDSRKVIRLSPISAATEADYTLALGDAAYWTNGVVSMFPPGAYSAVSGVVTVSLLSADQRIESIRPQFSGTDYRAGATISSDGSYAVITAVMANVPYPTAPPTHECYLEELAISVYADRTLVGSTQDLRAVTVLVRHPETTALATNTSDFLSASAGWVRSIIPGYVTRWYTSAASNAVTLLGGMVIRDADSPQQTFSLQARNNGYLDLAYASPWTNVAVLSVEALEPIPVLISEATGTVSTLTWSTNGISGTWSVQTAPAVTGVWVSAAIVATNTAAPGYMSVTASNAFPAWTSVFWRVHVTGETQAIAVARFGVPVVAPAYVLAGGGSVLTDPAAFDPAGSAAIARTNAIDPAARLSVSNALATALIASNEVANALQRTGDTATGEIKGPAGTESNSYVNLGQIAPTVLAAQIATNLTSIDISGTAIVRTNLLVYRSMAIGSSYISNGLPTANRLIVQGNVGIGTTNPTSLLHVNGAALLGQTTVSDLSSSSGGNWTLGSTGIFSFGTLSSCLRFNVAVPGTDGILGHSGALFITDTGSQRFITLSPKYAQTNSSAANTEIFINRTETSVGTGAQSFADFRVGNSTKFRVSNKGEITALGATTTSNAILSSVNYIDLIAPGLSLTGGGTAPQLTATGVGGPVFGMGYQDDDYAFGSLQMPHSLALTNATRSTLVVYPHIHWSFATAPTGGNTNVSWRLDYEWANMTEGFSATGFSVVVGNSLLATNSLLTAFDAVTNNSAGISSIFRFKLSRVPNGSNAFPATTRVIMDQFDVHVPVDRIGSSQERVQ